MIRLVVALLAEARPLIRRFGLRRRREGEPALWRGAEASLVVTGVGGAASAAGVEALAAGEGAGEAAWLNVGIGGHRTLPVGEIVLAHKVTRAAGGRAWYPPLVFEPPCATATVTTVERPETDYPEETVYEMEAAGFYAAVARHASAELIQVVKVISDNAGAPPDRLTATRVEELIEGRVDIVAEIARRTAELASELDRRRAQPAGYEELTRRWRFSVTQRRQLARLLRRLAVLEPAAAHASELADRPSARAVLAALERRLDTHPPGVG